MGHELISWNNAKGDDGDVNIVEAYRAMENFRVGVQRLFTAALQRKKFSIGNWTLRTDRRPWHLKKSHSEGRVYLAMPGATLEHQLKISRYAVTIEDDAVICQLVGTSKNVKALLMLPTEDPATDYFYIEDHIVRWWLRAAYGRDAADIGTHIRARKAWMRSCKGSAEFPRPRNRSLPSTPKTT